MYSGCRKQSAYPSNSFGPWLDQFPYDCMLFHQMDHYVIAWWTLGIMSTCCTMVFLTLCLPRSRVEWNMCLLFTNWSLDLLGNIFLTKEESQPFHISRKSSRLWMTWKLHKRLEYCVLYHPGQLPESIICRSMSFESMLGHCSFFFSLFLDRKPPLPSRCIIWVCCPFACIECNILPWFAVPNLNLWSISSAPPQIINGRPQRW